jgi:uncharacterized membrane protein
LTGSPRFFDGKRIVTCFNVDRRKWLFAFAAAPRGVAAIDSTIDSSIVSNLTTTIDFFNSKGTISIVDAIKHVEKTNVMTKIIFKI